MKKIENTYGSSRRVFIQTMAAASVATGFGSGAMAQEPGEIVLDAIIAGWEGVAPEKIEGEENPPLELAAGQTYQVTIENIDGIPHNFAIINEAGEQLVRSEFANNEGDTEAVEFEATEDMDVYYCEPHADTMRGDIEIVDVEAPVDIEELPYDDVPVAGDIPEGETVGLQKIAEGLPALTDFAYVEDDEEERHFIVTQTGQIYALYPNEMDDTPDNQEFVFEGLTGGWMGVEPEAIAGEENPTLELEKGQEYTFTWENADGQPHNIALRDAAGDDLEATEIIEVEGETQSLTFEATREMEEYLCEIHPMTMVGSITITDGESEESAPEEPEESEPGGATPDDMELFLDISDRMVDLGLAELGGYDERGLLGLAFHPYFAENRKFYVRYSAPRRDGTPEDFDHTDVLAEFEADEDLQTADPDSERTIMEIPQPQDNHNGGRLVFGPDGYLYTSIGDGGNIHDIGLGHVEDWYEENEGGNGQDTEENLLGGIHRIDVDPDSDEEAEGPDEGAYEIPDDNPLVGEEGQLEEYFAWGFRNPWGMSIDDEGTVFVTDAGQHAIESAYIVEQGGNYGWNVKEGSFCFSPEQPLQPPGECPDETPEDVRGGEPLRDPIVEFRHQRITEAFIDSSVVVGGHRYQGDAIPELQDAFVFANWSSEGIVTADGELLVATEPDEAEDMENDGEEIGPYPDRWDLTELVIEDADEGALNRYIYGVERDEVGELYVLTNTDYRPGGETGEIYKIVPADEGEEIPAPEQVETAEGHDSEVTPSDEDMPPEEASEATPDEGDAPDDNGDDDEENRY